MNAPTYAKLFYEDHYQGSNLPLNIPTLLANGDVSTATAYKGNNNHTVKKSSRYHHLTCKTREAVSKNLNGGDGNQLFALRRKAINNLLLA